MDVGELFPMTKRAKGPVDGAVGMTLDILSIPLLFDFGSRLEQARSRSEAEELDTELRQSEGQGE